MTDTPDGTDCKICGAWIYEDEEGYETEVCRTCRRIDDEQDT